MYYHTLLLVNYNINSTMENLLTSLFNYRVKRFTLSSAIGMFLLDLVVRQFQNELVNSYTNHILLQYGVLISLLTAALSKDKIDDELSVRVRYGILKNTFSFIVVIFGIAALLLSRTSITSIKTLTIVYGLEAMLVIHLILYHLGVRYHPKWLLKEDTAPKRFNKMMIIILSFYIGCIILVLVLSYFDL